VLWRNNRIRFLQNIGIENFKQKPDVTAAIDKETHIELLLKRRRKIVAEPNFEFENGKIDLFN